MDFDEWVHIGAPRLARFAYLVCGDAALAEDLTQDVLVEACARWNRLGRVEDIDAYLRRAVVNRRTSWWRKVGRRESLTPVVRPGTWTDADDRPDEDLWQALRELPARQRAAVVLRFYEHLSFAEVAGVLDCQESTARSLVHRALAHLRASDRIQELR